MDRRRFLRIAGAAGTMACAAPWRTVRAAQGVRLHERPTRPTVSIEPGTHRLGLGRSRDGLLYVPKGIDPRALSPLLVMMHGAGNQARAMQFTFPLAEEFRVVVLAPDSRGTTWDAILGMAGVETDSCIEIGPEHASAANDWYGPDVRFLDRALAHTFARCAIDPTRMALGGFSDGASYALSLGLSNGDLFRSILAFSPGFISSVRPVAKPRVLVSHGTRDRVLPIGAASRVIVEQLRKDRYDVTYREFEGDHSVPPAVARDGFAWFLKR
jgi:phospholipase/carboxylesterase